MTKHKIIPILLAIMIIPFALSLAPPVNVAPVASSQDPVTTHHFQVEWGGNSLDFHSVEGLESCVEVIEYRDGISPDYNPRKIPGRIHNSNIILRRIIKKSDNEMWEWYSLVLSNMTEYRDLTISILDEQHTPVVVYKIKNAWPCAYRGPLLMGGDRQLAIEEIEIAHNGMTVYNN